ncbi:MAG: pyridoxamine 5'-phosphate oxidase family protein [Mangrovibacterium sp.]
MRTLFIEDRKKIEAIIRSCKTCYLAVNDAGKPYVLPMNFGMDGNCIILHGAREGRLWECLHRNPEVCINWTLGEELAWQDKHVGCSYRVRSRSVIVEGTAGIVEDPEEKYRLLQVLMAQYSDREFRFGAPSVCNVAVYRVPVNRITAKAFGVPARVRPGKGKGGRP